MTTHDSDTEGPGLAPVSSKGLLAVLLCAWIGITGVFFFIRFSYVFFLSYREVIAALFRQFFDS